MPLNKYEVLIKAQVNNLTTATPCVQKPTELPKHPTDTENGPDQLTWI